MRTAAFVALALTLCVPCLASAKKKKDAPLDAVEAEAMHSLGIDDLRDFIFQKMAYDREYFQRVLRLKREGTKVKTMSPEEFDAEVRRARSNLPVLDGFHAELEDFASGKPLGLPKNYSMHREYTNLIALLNMLQAHERGNYRAVLIDGAKVSISGPESLGRVRGLDARYYIRLYREYYYLMASANYRAGADTEAVKWFARLEGDTDLRGLKKRVAAERNAVDRKQIRLDELRSQPLAVMPFQNLAKNEEADWMSLGLMEVATADLTQHTDLALVERLQLDKVLKEIELAHLGVTTKTHVRDLGKLLGAAALILGSFHLEGEQVLVYLKIVDGSDGRPLAAVNGQVQVEALFAGTRDLLIRLLTSAGWLDPIAEAELQAARSPRTGVVRDLLKARALKSTKSEEARALYARAIKEDPAYVRLFADLKEEFSDVSATVAVMPFVNVTANEADLWMTRGVAETLSGDLTKLNFTVVERMQLDTLLRAGEQQRVVGADDARAVGKQVGADFVVLGSLFHQAPQIRVDVRFVEVRTGIILFSVAVETGSDDFMGLLVKLSTRIAENMGEQLSKETIEDLVASQMSREDFEKYIRQELAKDALTDLGGEGSAVAGAPVEAGPVRWPFWSAVGVAGAGTALAATSYIIGDRHNDNAQFYDVLRQASIRQDDRERFANQQAEAASRGRSWSTLGHVSVGLSIASVGYLVYEELFGTPGKADGADLTPSVMVSDSGAQLSLHIDF